MGLLGFGGAGLKLWGCAAGDSVWLGVMFKPVVAANLALGGPTLGDTNPAECPCSAGRFGDRGAVHGAGLCALFPALGFGRTDQSAAGDLIDTCVRGGSSTAVFAKTLSRNQLAGIVLIAAGLAAIDGRRLRRFGWA